MTAVAVLTKDRSRALGRSPADGDTGESRWRAQIDRGKYGGVYCFGKNGLSSAPVQRSIKKHFLAVVVCKIPPMSIRSSI